MQRLELEMLEQLAEELAARGVQPDDARVVRGGYGRRRAYSERSGQKRATSPTTTSPLPAPINAPSGWCTSPPPVSRAAPHVAISAPVTMSAPATPSAALGRRRSSPLAFSSLALSMVRWAIL